MNNKQNKQIAGFLNNGFDFKGTKFRPLSASRMAILSRMDSSFLDENSTDNIKGLLDYLYVCSQPLGKLIKINKKEDFDFVVFEFGEDWNTADIIELQKLMSADIEAIGEAMTEAEDEKK